MSDVLDHYSAASWMDIWPLIPLALVLASIEFNVVKLPKALYLLLPILRGQIRIFYSPRSYG